MFTEFGWAELDQEKFIYRQDILSVNWEADSKEDFLLLSY